MTKTDSKTMMVDPETLPYRPCVGIMLINRQGLVWAGNRIQPVDTGSPLTWQMPQGGIDEGEDAREAAFRELREETGTDKAEIIGEVADWLIYDLPPHLVGHALKGKYRGQKQKWFAMRFTGVDGDIDIAADEHQEFSEWAWVPVSELVELIVPFKRGVYEQIVRELGPLARPLA
ncbi:MAG: RNA pyrophosphohydrolase [Parvibaculum sp.]|uniref:RNA pyrophosphohydrolase n=1 Tax=Parvibaculum sp. TaxID=2024848 RepID=UPI003C71895A